MSSIRWNTSASLRKSAHFSFHSLSRVRSPSLLAPFNFSDMRVTILQVIVSGHSRVGTSLHVHNALRSDIVIV
jgi:hypothetical protein